MGSSTPKTVGGGSATPVANGFNAWLLNGLNTGSFGNMGGSSGGGSNTLGGAGGDQYHQVSGPTPNNFGYGSTNPYGNGGANNGVTNGQQATNQQQGFSGTVNNLLNGQIGDPSSYSQYFNQANQLAQNGYQAPTFHATQYNQGTGYQGIDPNAGFQLGNPSGMSQYNMQQMPGFQNLMNSAGAQSAMGALGNISVQQPGQVGYGIPLTNMLQGQGQQAHLSDVVTPQMQALQGQLGGLQNLNNLDWSSQNQQGGAAKTAPDFNTDPTAMAMRTILNQKNAQDTADLRARFGQFSGGAYGSGAQYAETQQNAQALPQIQQALGQYQNQLAGQDLANRTLNQQGFATQANTLLGQRGQDVNALTQGYGNNVNALVNQRGQDLSNQTTNRQLDISQLGLADQQQQGNRGLDVTQRGQDSQAAIANANIQSNNQQALLNSFLTTQGQQNNYNQNVGLGMNQIGQQANANWNSNLLQGQQNNNSAASAMGNLGLNNNWNQFQSGFQNNQAQNNFNLNQNSMQNTFDQNNSQFGANLGINLGNLGQNMANSQLSGQQGILNQLFGSMNNAQRIGTPQAQTYMQPSGFSQFMNTALPLVGSAVSAGFNPFGSLFGGGGGMNTPNSAGTFGGGIPGMSTDGGGFSNPINMPNLGGMSMGPSGNMQNLSQGGGNGLAQQAQQMGPTGNFAPQGFNPSQFQMPNQQAMPNMMNGQGAQGGNNMMQMLQQNPQMMQQLMQMFQGQ